MHAIHPRPREVSGRLRRRPCLALSLVLAAAWGAAPADELLLNGGFEDQAASAQSALHWKAGHPGEHGDTWGSASREAWRSHGGSHIMAVRGAWKVSVLRSSASRSTDAHDTPGFSVYGAGCGFFPQDIVRRRTDSTTHRLVDPILINLLGTTLRVTGWRTRLRVSHTVDPLVRPLFNLVCERHQKSP